MSGDLADKRVLVVSDDANLAKAIELNLTNPTKMRIEHWVPGWQARWADVGDCDLLVVATSSPCSEPVVMLAQASLGDRIGQGPLLIISDRRFQPVPGACITHLDFPFEPDELRARVKGILRGG